MVGTMGGLVFTNQDASLGKELWTSDGTAKGTRLAQDIAPGPGDSLPKEYTELGTRLFFLADDRATGYEPWAVHTAILFRQPARAIQDMKTDVKTLKLGSVQETSLLQKLDAAAQAFSGGRIPQALDALLRFKIAVREQTPRWISEAMAADLIQFAEEGMELLRHPDADAGALPKPGPAPRYYANQ
jgi:ELWxxDGT repeat protein